MGIKRTLRTDGYVGEEREMHISYVDKDEYVYLDVYFQRMATKLKKVNAELLEVEYYLKGESEVDCGWRFRMKPEQLSFRNRKKEDHELTPEEIEKKRIKAEASRQRILDYHASKSS